MGLELLRVWEANRTSIVFVTHSVLEALFLSDRVVVFSARPGRVMTIIDVDLPRPRRLDMLGSPEVGALANRIRGLLGAQLVS
jgi:NitT/TauT family transport system ATP-binding protein